MAKLLLCYAATYPVDLHVHGLQVLFVMMLVTAPSAVVLFVYIGGRGLLMSHYFECVTRGNGFPAVYKQRL